MTEFENQKPSPEKIIAHPSGFISRQKGVKQMIGLQILLLLFFLEEFIREYMINGWDNDAGPYNYPMTNITAMSYFLITILILFVISLIVHKARIPTKWILFDMVPLELLFITLLIILYPVYQFPNDRTAKNLIFDSLFAMAYGYFLFLLFFACIRGTNTIRKKLHP